MNRYGFVVILCAALGVVGVCGCAKPEDDIQKQGIIDAMYSGYKESFPDVPEITATQLAAAVAGNGEPVIVDVREPQERAVSMIPGAVSVETFEERIGEYKDRRVVVHCTIGLRSGRYAVELRDRNQDALNLKGGILAWAHAGGALVDDSGPTRRVHVYGSKWDLTPRGYEPVW